MAEQAEQPDKAEKAEQAEQAEQPGQPDRAELADRAGEERNRAKPLPTGRPTTRTPKPAHLQHHSSLSSLSNWQSPPSPSMTTTTPVGEDGWVDYIDQARRTATESRNRGDGVGIEQRVGIIEMYKAAVQAEPGSLKTWLAYCEYFWTLYTEFQPHAAPSPACSREDHAMGQELFSLDCALHLWLEAYDAIKFRLSDSHELWNRWISLEMEQLVKTRTPEGVRRITHLYRDRLQVPHVTWEETSQMFSTFLSDHNRDAWEKTMQAVTREAQEAKRLLGARDPFEVRLSRAARLGRDDEYGAAFREYLEWEILQSRRNNDRPEIGVDMCCGLFDRALTGAFARDEDIWIEYAIFLSQSHVGELQSQSPSQPSKSKSQPQSQSQSQPQPPSGSQPHQSRNLLQVLKRAVDHCPWSGVLWSRQILAAEEAQLPLWDIAHIKHAAMSRPEIFRDGMSGLMDIYLAWCGFLKRTAMNPNASDEDVDVADVGLATALEDVEVEGRAHFKNYQGDPEIRLERLYIQYLTEKKGLVSEARKVWNKLAGKPMCANSYDFWLRYHAWEMIVFAAESKKASRSPSPTPGSGSGSAPATCAGPHIPSAATAVLAKSIFRRSLDWPEKLMDVYLQHCNDYEGPAVVRRAIGDVHRLKKQLKKRREKEAASAAAAYIGHVTQPLHAHDQPLQNDDHKGKPQPWPAATESPLGGKRKRDQDHDDDDQAAEDGPGGGGAGDAVKRAKTDETDQKHATAADPLVRDRENTSVIVTNLPADVTQTKVKQYFRDYGHVNNICLAREDDGQSSTALIEFRTADEADSAIMFRNDKYFGQAQIGVRSGHNLILYVTNYPPEADEASIRHLFADCGRILSVRFPSLKYNAHRRFCYVSFREPAAAEKAIGRDGNRLDGGGGGDKHYRLTVKYSNPGLRKRRAGALAEGREIHLTNVVLGATEGDVRELCGKHGAVVKVNIPRNMAGKSRGFAFVEFEKKEQAEAAVAELNMAKFRGAILGVEIAKEKNFKPSAKISGNSNVGTASPSSAPPSRDDAYGHGEAMDEDGGDNGEAAAGYGDDDGHDHPAAAAAARPTPAELRARTVALSGLPETVNDTRVRAAIEGAGRDRIVKLTLRPGSGTAKIEYENAAAAGRAALQLNGIEIGGQQIRAGGVDELWPGKSRGRDDGWQQGGSGDPPAAVKAKSPSNGLSKPAAIPSATAFIPSTVGIRRPTLATRGGRGGLRRGGGLAKKVSGDS